MQNIPEVIIQLTFVLLPCASSGMLTSTEIRGDYRGAKAVPTFLHQLLTLIKDVVCCKWHVIVGLHLGSGAPLVAATAAVWHHTSTCR